jgi:hypothetical protein
MREFVARQRQAREYDKFVQRKVKIARASRLRGEGHSDEEVEAELSGAVSVRSPAGCRSQHKAAQN